MVPEERDVLKRARTNLHGSSLIPAQALSASTPVLGKQMLQASATGSCVQFNLYQLWV